MTRTLSPRTIALLPEIAAVLLAAMIGATAWLGFAYRQETAAVQHTLGVEKKLSQLLSSIQDAESGNRGFLLTGDEIHLQVYDRAVAVIEGEFNDLKTLAENDEGLQRSLASLRPVVQDRLALLQQGIELRRSGGLDAAVRHVRTNRGHDVMQQVRAGIAQLQAVEANSLQERSAAARRLIRAASLAATAGIVLIIFAIAGWIWNQRRDARRLAIETAERQEAEAQLRQLQKIEALGQLTSGIAHDFNNMLTVVISGLSLVRRRLTAGDTNVLDVADAAIDGAQRAAALTSRLMAFARQQPLQPQPLDVNRLIAGMADMINSTIGETIVLDSVLAANLWRAHVDAPQLESALLNLCVNARDAMPEGGKLTIETVNAHLDEDSPALNMLPRGDYVLIIVSDTGIGMAPDVAVRAFEPYFTTKGEGKGTGLGLSQVHGFVKQSGGQVEILSRPGRGTSIKLYLQRFSESSSPDAGTRAGEPDAAITR